MDPFSLPDSRAFAPVYSAHGDLPVQLATLLFTRGPVGISQLAQELNLPPDRVRRGIEVLSTGGCILELSPQHIRLAAVGRPFWRGILENICRAQNRRLGADVLVFQQTGSTNDVCIQAAQNPPAKTGPLVVLADTQTRGRGRWGRQWAADAGQSVLMSVLLPESAIMAETLTLAVGVSCARAVEKITGMAPELKWPNDLLLGGRKLAGVLIETAPRSAGGGRCFIIGIGLNVLQRPADFPPGLRDTATSLQSACGQTFDRLSVIDRLLLELEHLLTAPPQPAAVAVDWKSRSAMLGRPVHVRRNGVEIQGRIADVDPLAGLIVRDHAGTIHFCPAAETTLLADEA